MRASACDTLSQFCAWRVLCWSAFPLVPVLGSTDSAADCSALFASFTATMPGSDFPPPYIIGYGSSPSRCGPGQSIASGQTRDLPASGVFLLHVMCSSTRQGDSTSHSGAAHIAFDLLDGLGPCVLINFVAHLDTPCNRCVRFVAGVAVGSRNPRYRVPC